MGPVLAFLRRHEVPINAIALSLGAYAAVASALRGAKYPSESFWAPWGAPFVALLVAVVFVPVFAFYKVLDARDQKAGKAEAERGRLRAELAQDVAVDCQLLVTALLRACPSVALDDLAAGVWLCDEKTGLFTERYRFYLPFYRAASGVRWARGVGVAGMVWKLDEPLAVDLAELHGRLAQLGPAQFDELPSDARYGLTAAEVLNTKRYTGIVGRRLVGADGRLLAVLVVDYTGTEMGTTGFGCLAAEFEQPGPVDQQAGHCAEVLDKRVKQIEEAG